MLYDDIHDPALTGRDSHPDTFMLRANQLGLALFKCEAYAVAERLYRLMAEMTERYRDETGNWRHAGAIYANTAAACAAQGDIDEAVVQLFRAAEDDIPTYPITQAADSYAIRELLAEYFSRPICRAALRVLKSVDPNLSMSDLETLTEDLGDLAYAFLACVRLAILHEESNHASPNVFSQLQLFSALRSLSSLLEVYLKTVANEPAHTFFPAARALFGDKPWWSTWDTTRQKLGATRNSPVPVDQRLRDALALAPADDAEAFWRSLLVAYIVRNYTVHQLETQCALVQIHAMDTLAHILHVFVAARRYT
jgi:hypothetical protein